MVDEELLLESTSVPNTRLAADPLLMEITSVLYNISCSATNQRARRKKSKAGSPIWNESIKAALQVGKLANAVWKRAGSPKCGTNPVTLRRKIARRKLRKCIRFEFTNKRETFLTL